MRYPLAWEESYSRKGAQWRGAPNFAQMMGEMALSGRVLELGVGNGNTALRILARMNQGAQLLCVDVARGALRTLPPAPREDSRASIVQCDVRSLPFKGSGFSSIFAVHILTHMLHGDESRLLAEVERVLQPEGRALFEVFAPGDMRHGTGEEVEPRAFQRADGLITRFYDEAELRKVLRDAGLTIAKFETVSRAIRHDGKKYSRESIVAVAGKHS